jgi:hypothetical protein
VINTGIKFFYLEEQAPKKAKNLSTVSTKSIQSEIGSSPKPKEIKAKPNSGCFCF